jgi:hypothetical protein
VGTKLISFEGQREVSPEEHLADFFLAFNFASQHEKRISHLPTSEAFGN